MQSLRATQQEVMQWPPAKLFPVKYLANIFFAWTAAAASPLLYNQVYLNS